MEAQRQSRSRGRRLVAMGGAIVAGVAAGAGMIQVWRRRTEEAELWAELWAEAQRTDLPPVAESLVEQSVELGTEPETEPEPAADVEPEAVPESGPGQVFPAELGPHDPSYGEVV